MTKSGVVINNERAFKQYSVYKCLAHELEIISWGLLQLVLILLLPSVFFSTWRFHAFTVFKKDVKDSSSTSPPRGQLMMPRELCTMLL